MLDNVDSTAQSSESFEQPQDAQTEDPEQELNEQQMQEMLERLQVPMTTPEEKYFDQWREIWQKFLERKDRSRGKRGECREGARGNSDNKECVEASALRTRPEDVLEKAREMVRLGLKKKEVRKGVN